MTSRFRLVLLLGLAIAGGACDRGAPAEPALARVAAIHGAPGPFAVAGFRVGERALRELGLNAGAFDIEVVHESPAEVQWSCIADGVQAATGASAGKLNLALKAVPQPEMRTVVRKKSTGATLIFRLTPSFAARFANRPRGELAHAGAEVLRLSDDEIFAVERRGF
jgi:formylmethanofuran dehydrogenase subunit E